MAVVDPRIQFLLALVERIAALLQTRAAEETAQQTYDQARAANLQALANTQILNNALYGLSALKAAILSLDGQEASHFTTLLAAITDVNPVTLPTTPPTGYGGASVSDIWTDTQVFGPPFSNDSFQASMAGLLVSAVTFQMERFAAEGVKWSENPWITCFQNQGQDVFDLGSDWAARLRNSAELNDFSWSDWVSGVDIATFLNGVTGWTGWSHSNPFTGRTSDYAWVVLDGSFNTNYTFLRCDITNAQQAWITGAAAAGGLTAPIWPGLAGVTLGTPVALADRVVIEEALHGVLVNVTSPPHGLGKFEIGSQSFWYRLGMLYFVSDNGDVEAAQPLGCGNAIYVPKTMAEASGALLRVKGDPEGTVTPWTLL